MEKSKVDTMNLILVNQLAIQNELPSWTYQAEMRISLLSGTSETMEVKVFTTEGDQDTKLELAIITISLNNLSGKAYQFQSVLNSVNAIGTSGPIVKIGISDTPNAVPDTWWTLQVDAISALKQIAAENPSTTITFFIQLSGLSLPYVHTASTTVHCSMGEISFRAPQHPEPRYSGDFQPLGTNKQFPNMESACEAVIARGLSMPLQSIGLSCDVRYRYLTGGALPVEIPVCLIPFTLIDTKSFTSVLSKQISFWLKEHAIALAEKQELIFTLSVYSPDENTKTPWLIIDAVKLPLENVQIKT